MPVSYPFFTELRGFSNREFFALNAIYYAAMCIFELPTGAFADRVSRRAALRLGCLGIAIAAIALLAAHDFAGAALGMTCMAFGHTLLSGSDSAWLFDHLAAEGRVHDYLEMEGWSHAARMCGVSAAFIAGGAAARAFGLGAAFVVAAVTALVALAAALSFDEPPRARSPSDPRFDLRRSLAKTRAHPELRWILAYSTLLFLLLRVAFHFYQPYMHEVGIDDPLVYGAVLGGLNLVGAPFARLARRLDASLGERALSLALPLMMCVSFVALGLVGSRAGIALFALQQVPYALMNPVTRNYTQRHLHSYERATMFSVQSVCGRLLTAGFALIAGEWLERRGSVAEIQLGLGLFALVASACLWISMPKPAVRLPA